MRAKPYRLTADERWHAFEDAYTDCLRVAAEYARYQWFWDQRTQWLAEHAEERETARWQERRAKRHAMTEPWSELRLTFMDQARIVQACAMCLGMEARDRLRTEFKLDYTRTGDTLDIYLGQWRELLTFNPEPVPF